jgi:hypothetical protein
MPNSLEHAQFHAFGYIISTYAKVEQGFKFLIGHLVDVPRPIAMMLCEPYTTANLRNVTKIIAAAYDLPCDIRQRIADMVGELKSFGKLRNDIGHNMWKDGVRPNSIKPIHLDIRSGKPVFRGAEDGERDWTIEELEAEAVRLNALHSAQLKLLRDLGVENMDE